MAPAAAAAHALLAARDAVLAEQRPHSTGEPGDVRVESLAFNDQTDEIGHGRYGHVFRCHFGQEKEPLAVKRVERLCFGRGGYKEVSALLHAQNWDTTTLCWKCDRPVCSLECRLRSNCIFVLS